MLHPMIAVAAALFAVLMSRLIARKRPDATTQRLSIVVISLFGVQVMAGALNIALLAPVWMQVIHLALAQAVWLAVVLLGASAFAGRTEPAVSAEQPALKVAQP